MTTSTISLPEITIGSPKQIAYACDLRAKTTHIPDAGVVGLGVRHLDQPRRHIEEAMLRSVVDAMAQIDASTTTPDTVKVTARQLVTSLPSLAVTWIEAPGPAGLMAAVESVITGKSVAGRSTAGQRIADTYRAHMAAVV